MLVETYPSTDKHKQLWVGTTGFPPLDPIVIFPVTDTGVLMRFILEFRGIFLRVLRDGITRVEGDAEPMSMVRTRTMAATLFVLSDRRAGKRGRRPPKF